MKMKINVSNKQRKLGTKEIDDFKITNKPFAYIHIYIECKLHEHETRVNASRTFHQTGLFNFFCENLKFKQDFDLR